MDIDQVRVIVRETCNAMEKKPKHKKLEFSKGIIVFASVIFGLTWAVGAVSWFIWRDFPQGLAQLTTALYGVALTIYGAKAGIENRAKIGAGIGID